LGEPRALRQEAAQHLLDLAHESLGLHLGRILHRAVDLEEREDAVDVGIGRQRAEIAERFDLAAHVVHRAGHHHAQEGEGAAARPCARSCRSRRAPRVRRAARKRLPPWRSPWNTP
jgi:hypothetical protein